MQKRFALNFRIVVALLIVLVGVSTFTRPARACGGGGRSGSNTGALVAIGLVFASGVVVTDTVFIVHDVSRAREGRPASRGMAIAELPVFGLQTWLAASISSDVFRHDGATGAKLIAGTTTTFFAAMTLHGLLTLLTADYEEDARLHPVTSSHASDQAVAPEAPRFSLTPTMLPVLGAGTSIALAPGFAASGTF